MFNMIKKQITDVSEFKDPFTKDSVEWINIELHNCTSPIFRDGYLHEATVYLKNGNTGLLELEFEHFSVLKKAVSGANSGCYSLSYLLIFSSVKMPIKSKCLNT